MGRLIRSVWDWFYDKVKAMILGYVFGGGLALLVTEGLNSADTTDLSSSERAVWSLLASLAVGLFGAIRKTETKVMVMPPGE